MKTSKKRSDEADFFADTLRVRQICSGETVKKEEPKIQNLTRKERSQSRSNFPDYERRKTGSNIERTGLKFFLPEKKTLKQTTGVNEKINVPRQLKRGQLGSEIKMISVNLPRFGRGEAVIRSNKNVKEEPSYDKSLDANIQDGIPGELNYDQPSTLLEEAKKEIDISQNQLQKIQTILKNRNSEESYSLKPKWNSFPLNTTKVNSKEKVISTLNTLNKKLNDMQEKYFQGTKSSFKSIRDFSPKMESQSISEVDITESSSDLNIQIEDKDKILEQFHLSKIKKLQNLISEEKGTSVNNIKDEINQIRKEFRVPTEMKAMMNVTESNSDCILPTEAKNRILEKFHLSKIQRMCDNFVEPENANKYGKALHNKSQNFATTVPDVILRDDSQYDILKTIEKKSDQNAILKIHNDSSGVDFNQNSQKDIDIDFVPRVIDHIEKDKINFTERDAEELRELLLTQDKKTTEKLEEVKSCNLVSSEVDNELLYEANSFDFNSSKNKITEENAVRSKSSETHYFDCDSKSASPCLTSTTSNKKIFYDNYRRFSNEIDRKEQKQSSMASSVPNLSSKEQKVTCETMTRSDKEIFDNTPLQDAILHSEYLTKTFTIDSSGNFAESDHNQVTKNKSDQFFNGRLDFENQKTKDVKGFKTTKDMYLTLSKALSNSFYKLPPQN